VAFYRNMKMTNGGWDFEVVRVDLDVLGVDAGQRLGMVIVQPEYKLVPDAEVPFRISDECREAQKGLIEKAFQIRAAESIERSVPIPFILFPEASIPVCGQDSLDYLRQQIEQAQGEIIFIGGLEGLSPQEAQEVTNRFVPSVDAARPTFTAGAFVNLCVIAVKSANGQLSWYFQAKLRPSQWEQPRNMAHGHRVLYFIAPQVAFLCQICFDQIAAQGEEAFNATLCRQLIKKTQHSAATLDFVFVPQCNPKVEDISMRQNRSCLLNHQDRAFKNDMTAVVVVNKATNVQEPSEYGRSGFHYRAGRWQIPTLDVGPKGYELYDLDGVTSAVFRKRTPAIHVATLVPPSYNVGNSGNPRQPLENPRSYLIREGCDATPCSCLPGTTLAVGTFVECDCLPCKLRDTLLATLPANDEKRRWQGSDAGQSQLLGQHYGKIRKDLLMLGASRARELVDLLLSMHDPNKGNRNNPDLWTSLQFEAVVELLSALSVLAELQPVNFNAPPWWTAWLGESFAVAVLDGVDDWHFWQKMELEYRKKFEGQYYHPDARRKPVLLAALRSRGQVQPFVKRSWLEITEPADQNRLGDEDSYTKPTPLRFYVCQSGLFDEARQAPTIKTFLESEMRCVLE